MNIIVWLIVGGVIGWLASVLMRSDGQQGLLMNVVVGVVGAFIGGFLIGPLIGGGTINAQDFSVASLVVSLLGAVILLAGVKLLRRATG